MTFHDVRLPEDVEKGAQGGPEFKTTVIELSSGFEKRNIDWSRARGEWDISFGLDKKSNLEAVLAFFYARQGRAHSFRFKDWTDFEIGLTAPDTVQAIGIGDGAEDRFQVVRRYVSGPTTFDRAVTRLVVSDPAPRVFLDAAEQFAGFTLDNGTGVLDFVVAPNVDVVVGIIAEFDLPVRFQADKLDLRAVRDDTFSMPAIVIRELRETLVAL